MSESLTSLIQTSGLGILAAVITAAIIAIGNYIFRPKAKLWWGQTHGFVHTVGKGENAFLVYTTSYIVENIGRKQANNVQIVLNFEPQSYSIWPQIHYEEENNPATRFVIKIGSMAAREQITINLLQTPVDTPKLLNVKSDEVLGTLVPYWTVYMLNQWQKLIFVSILGLGLLSFVYLVLFVILRAFT